MQLLFFSQTDWRIDYCQDKWKDAAQKYKSVL